MTFEEYLNGLTGLNRSAEWGIAKLVLLHEVFKDASLLRRNKEKLTRTEFVVEQWELRSAILSSCSKQCYQCEYDSNKEDLIWVHGNWFNDKLFIAVSRIILCCGGRITYQA